MPVVLSADARVNALQLPGFREAMSLPDQAEQLRAHLTSCSQCRARLDNSPASDTPTHFAPVDSAPLPHYPFLAPPEAEGEIGRIPPYRVLRLIGEGGCWDKVSGAHRLSQQAPDYPDARPFHEALVRANPERLVWGSDWPHPRIEGEMPDAGRLFELFQRWTSDAATRQRILVDNPARLYGFSD